MMNTTPPVPFVQYRFPAYKIEKEGGLLTSGSINSQPETDSVADLQQRALANSTDRSYRVAFDINSMLVAQTQYLGEKLDKMIELLQNRNA